MDGIHVTIYSSTMDPMAPMGMKSRRIPPFPLKLRQGHQGREYATELRQGSRGVIHRGASDIGLDKLI